jgi:hemolysin activation/secretion protein
MLYQIKINNISYPFKLTENRNTIDFTLKNPLIYKKNSKLHIEVTVWYNNYSYTYELITYAKVTNQKFIFNNRNLKLMLFYNREIICDCNSLKKNTCISDCVIKLKL